MPRTDDHWKKCKLLILERLRETEMCQYLSRCQKTSQTLAFSVGTNLSMR